jgi:hypothetical protein
MVTVTSFGMIMQGEGQKMSSWIRKRFSYTNIVVTGVLMFAMSGGAYAASKVLITSTKQIKPSVLKELRGKAGANGAPGSAGPQGAAGAPGSAGPQGAAGAKGDTGAQGVPGNEGTEGKTGYAETLPSGKTLEGQWSASGWNGTTEQHSVGIVSTAVSFPFRVENETHEGPIVHYIKKEGITPQGCTGTAKNPGAARGHLCVFASVETENLLGVTVCDYSLTNSCAPNTKANPAGFVIQSIVTGEGLVNVAGTWAVTAE